MTFADLFHKLYTFKFHSLSRSWPCKGWKLILWKYDWHDVLLTKNENNFLSTLTFHGTLNTGPNTRVTSRHWWTVPPELRVWTLIPGWWILKPFCWSGTSFRLLLGQLLGALVFTDEEETKRSAPGAPADTERHLAQMVNVRTAHKIA